MATPHCNSKNTVAFQYYAWGIAASVLSCCGIVGNIISIKVLRQSQMRSPTAYYLLSLAVYDIILILSKSMCLALPKFYQEKGLFESYYFAYMYMHPYAYPVIFFSQTGHIYTTLMCTLERFLDVTKSQHAAHMCTMSMTKKMICIIFAFSVIYHIPRIWEYETALEWSDDHNRTVPIISYTEIGRNHLFQGLYLISANLVIMFLLPFTLTLTLIWFLMRAVKTSLALRRLPSSLQMKENNFTVMLIVVTSFSLACQNPAIVSNILTSMFDQTILHCSVELVVFTTVSYLLVDINTAINFCLYIRLSKRFRRLTKTLCVKKNESKFKYTLQRKRCSRFKADDQRMGGR